MPNEYFCRAYRYELYSAMCEIETETQEEALQKLKQMEEDGDLLFDGFCEAMPVNEFVVEPCEGDAGELTQTFPENCLYDQRRINKALLKALKTAEAFMSALEGDERHEGLAGKLAAIRTAMAEGQAKE